jgi:Tfp pilus assembly protein FimT
VRRGVPSRRPRRGQSTTEYLLVIAVLSVALALAMSVFFSAVYSNTDSLADRLIDDLTTGGAQ